MKEFREVRDIIGGIKGLQTPSTPPSVATGPGSNAGVPGQPGAGGSIGVPYQISGPDTGQDVPNVGTASESRVPTLAA